MSHSIITNSEKSIISKHSCDDILKCKEQMRLLIEKHENIALNFPIHSKANYRDALIHFDKLYTNIDEEEVICQKYALDEHLQRCIKDACIHLANVYFSVVTPILTSANLFEKKDEAFIERKQKSIENSSFIFDEAKELKEDLRYLTITNLHKVIIYLQSKYSSKFENEQFFDSEDFCKIMTENIKQSLFDFYSCNAFELLSKKTIIDLRKIIHKLYNHVLEMRSASSMLIKTYNNQEQDMFSEFIEIIDELYLYLNKNYLLGLIYVLPLNFSSKIA